MPRQFTLGKNERLKSRKKIEQLFAEGKSFSCAPFRVYYVTTPSGNSSPLLFGIGVSGKSFKRAVERNRIKRLSREAWRLQKNELKEKLKATNRQMSVFFIYTGKEMPDYKTIQDKVAVALKKLLAITDETPASDS